MRLYFGFIFLSRRNLTNICNHSAAVHTFPLFYLDDLEWGKGRRETKDKIWNKFHKHTVFLATNHSAQRTLLTGCVWLLGSPAQGQRHGVLLKDSVVESRPETTSRSPAQPHRHRVPPRDSISESCPSTPSRSPSCPGTPSRSPAQPHHHGSPVQGQQTSLSTH